MDHKKEAFLVQLQFDSGVLLLALECIKDNL